MAYTKATFNLKELLDTVQMLRAAVEETQQTLLRKWRPHLKNRTFIPSATNLAAYVGLRRHDLRALQQQLATLGLESMVKQDIPSRAEITDAAMAERAECVMLNKGPYIFNALDILDSVVSRMQYHQLKKTAQLRALHW